MPYNLIIIITTGNANVLSLYSIKCSRSRYRTCHYNVCLKRHKIGGPDEIQTLSDILLVIFEVIFRRVYGFKLTQMNDCHKTLKLFENMTKFNAKTLQFWT